MAYRRSIDDSSLVPYGWGDHWRQLLAKVPGEPSPGRVVRHDGMALLVATADSVAQLTLRRRLVPEPTVGDWVAVVADEPVAVLARSSWLSRRSGDAEVAQSLAANVDQVFVVCGLDRPINPRRVEREMALANDAPATPVIVLTKAAAAPDGETVAAKVAVDHPGVQILVTSVKEGIGVSELRHLAQGSTVTLLGESGAGKSSIVNALMGDDVAETGEVRRRDAKGRHTTTTRQLHLLAGGGVIIDSPGIRAVGLWVDPESVTDTFGDIEQLAVECRFADCAHRSEPSCAVTAAVIAGTLDAVRVEAWRVLRDEAQTPAGRRPSGRPRLRRGRSAGDDERVQRAR